MDLSLYKDPNLQVPQEDVVQNIEEGTLVDRERKKKKKNKNKNKDANKNREIDEDKIKEEAKLSDLHQIKELSNEEKILFS